MTVLRLQNIYMASRDVARATRFYEEAFGIVVRFTDGTKWAQLDAAGSSLALAGQGESAVKQGAVPVFEVADLSASARSVLQAGGEVLDVRDMGDHGLTQVVRDLDGNTIQLFQRASVRPG